AERAERRAARHPRAIRGAPRSRGSAAHAVARGPAHEGARSARSHRLRPRLARDSSPTPHVQPARPRPPRAPSVREESRLELHQPRADWLENVVDDGDLGQHDGPAIEATEAEAQRIGESIAVTDEAEGIDPSARDGDGELVAGHVEGGAAVEARI